MPEEVVKVSIGKEKYTTQIYAGNHHFIGDEPPEYEGADLGPAPYDFLLGSLGSCSAITIRMYADRKEWDLDKVEISLGMEKEKLEGTEFITHITRKVKLFGNLDEKQRERLLKIADACPVAKIMKNEIRIKSELIL